MSIRLRIRCLLLALGLLAAAPAPASAGSACKLRGSTTIVKTVTARVFQKKARLRLGDGSSVGGYRVYGCSSATNRRFLLGLQKDVDGESEWIERKLVRLAGPFVGYAHGFDSGMDGGQLVEVRDLRTGKLVYETENESLVTVLDLELAASGSVAFISDEEEAGGRGVYAWSASTGRTQLDFGSDIKGRSLTLSGSTLAWTKGGVMKSQALPGG